MSLSRIRIIYPKYVFRIQDDALTRPVATGGDAFRCRQIPGDDGIKRIYAATGLMMETLQCYVLDVDLQQAKLLVLFYNRPHQSMEGWEEALVLADLAEHHNLSQQRHSRLTGCSRSWVSQRLSLISKISDELSSKIRMGIIGSSQARANEPIA